MDDLHFGGFRHVVYTGDSLVAWSASIHSIKLGSKVYGSFLEEFPVSHENTVDDEHCFSSTNGRSVKEDHLDFRGNAMSMHS